VSTTDNWYSTIRKDVLDNSAKGRSVLILFETIQQSLTFAKWLGSKNFQVLNGMQDTQSEVYIVSKAGNASMITISTNKAGWGMDITTTPDCDAAGGLHVILGFFPLNNRVQQQAEGRTARMGKNGTVQMIINREAESVLKECDIEDIKSMEFLNQFREYLEVKCSKTRQQSIIPLARLLDKLVVDFCVFIEKNKAKVNEYTLLAIKENWAEWLSEIDNQSDLEPDPLQFQIEVEKKYSEFTSKLVDVVNSQTVIQNPDIYVSWGNSLSGSSSIDKYNKAIQLDTGHPFAYLQRGFVYGRTEQTKESQADFELAIFHFSRQIELNPTKADYFLGRTQAYQQMDQPTKSQKDFCRVLVLDSGNLTAFLGNATSLEELNRWDEGIQNYRSLISECRKCDLSVTRRSYLYEKVIQGFIEAKQYTEAKVLCEETLALLITDTEMKGTLNLKMAYILIDGFNSLDLAIKYLQKAIEVAPGNTFVRDKVVDCSIRLADHYVEKNDINGQINAYALANKLIPDNHHSKYELNIMLAAWLEQRGDIDTAISFYKCAIYLNETNPSATECLADLYRELKKYDLAIEFYNAALKIDPNSKLVKLHLYMTYADLAQNALDNNQNEQAIKYCNHIIITIGGLDGEQTCRIFNLAGLARKCQKNFAKAIDNFNIAIQANSEEDCPKSNLAYLYLTLANKESQDSRTYNVAIRYYRLAIRVGTLDKIVLSALNHDFGLLFKKMGDSTEAIRLFKEALRLDNSCSKAKINLSLIYNNIGVDHYNRGKMYQARTAFKEAQRYDPSDRNIRKNILLTYD